MPLFHAPIQERRYLEPSSWHRKFCACMSLRGGCAFASLIWLGVNTYIATLSFLGYTPIFSFLHRPALITLGIISIVFSLIAAYIIYGLFKNSPAKLQSGFILLFLIVIIYLIDILVNIFIFCVQKSSYIDWCLSMSQQKIDEKIEGKAINGTIYQIDDLLPSLNVYNCQKLWENEIKFSIAVFMVMTICYGYWTLCVFYYYGKLRDLFSYQSFLFNGNIANNLHGPNNPLPQHMFKNINSSKK
ncbi:uncharacterized protein BX663DRAFT_517378 [Cokeromyces recurvatus]|uniref:uncharacterized protein n=1 Tax=Cokeromyces recurvatus TaxID=90255 RepID=UPI0022212407|nr:uncharacterized protein BX663DRAFT_517378 [Cokeromyces recurvatus]KAI7900377.1 hypothetical protein BX663DRAFT_517378 [Cokeromyces recurvatus]